MAHFIALAVPSLALSIFVSNPPASPAAAPPPTQEDAPKGKPLGTLFGKPVFLDDLRPPTEMLAHMAKSETKTPEEWLQSQQGKLLRASVFRALTQKYIQEHGLEVTDAELDEFQKSTGFGKQNEVAMMKRMAADLRNQLENLELTDETRTQLKRGLERTESKIKDEEEGTGWPDAVGRNVMKLESREMNEKLKDPQLHASDRAAIERRLAFNRRFQDLSDEQAAKEWKVFKREIERDTVAPFILSWKLNRDLFKKYGGRILWQQAGMEPIDAVRQWLEESEKAGDFTVDPEIKESFWYYYKDQDHGAFIVKTPNGDEFDAPMWAKKGKE